MIKTLKRIICCCLALLMLLLVGCGDNGGATTDNNTSDTSADTSSGATADTAYTPQALASFVIIRADKASDELISAIKQLNATVKELCGSSLPMYSDFGAAEEKEYEIVVGSAKRDCASELEALGENEYVIKTVARSGGASVIVGGSSDKTTALAVYELESFIKSLAANGEKNVELPMIEQKGNTTDLVIDEATMKSMVVIRPETADDTLGVAVKFFKNDMTKTVGSNVELKMLKDTADLSSYKNAVIVGAVGAEAKAIRDSLPDKGYTVKIVNENGGTRIYVVGKDDMVTMHALQYFYSKAVVNGKMSFHKYFNITATTLIQRDPCIVPFEGKYYMYVASGMGYGVRVSEDLLNWSAITQIFDGSKVDGFDGDTNFWAPECHYYNGKFYLFATYHSTENDHRGCAVFRCDTPNGTFTLISKRSKNAAKVGHMTPADWDAIDATLYVDENGKPWAVFVYEWTSTSDGIGRMAYAPMSDDLTYLTAEPTVMFKANDPAWSSYKVTDGPYLYKCEDGTLLMIWSNMGANGYAVGIAKSSNGRLDGEWTQVSEPLLTGNRKSIYSAINGGHGMLFRDFDGRLYLSIHGPNDSNIYAAMFTLVPLIEKDGMLYLDTVS